MRGMKHKPTRKCHYRHCQRHDESVVRVEVNHPATGELVATTLRFCPAHTPEVWDLIGIRQSIEEALAA
jgi:hypothetical protein